MVSRQIVVFYVHVRGMVRIYAQWPFYASVPPGRGASLCPYKQSSGVAIRLLCLGVTVDRPLTPCTPMPTPTPTPTPQGSLISCKYSRAPSECMSFIIRLWKNWKLSCTYITRIRRSEVWWPAAWFVSLSGWLIEEKKDSLTRHSLSKGTLIKIIKSGDISRFAAKGLFDLPLTLSVILRHEACKVSCPSVVKFRPDIYDTHIYIIYRRLGVRQEKAYMWMHTIGCNDGRSKCGATILRSPRATRGGKVRVVKNCFGLW